MGQITSTFLGDRLQIAWKFNGPFMNLFVGSVHSFS